MQARGRLVISLLLMLILAPWVGAIDGIEKSEKTELSETFPELNDAQVDAILSTGARGVTTWIKQGTANPSATNGPGNFNSVWISDVINGAAGLGSNTLTSPTIPLAPPMLKKRPWVQREFGFVVGLLTPSRSAIIPWPPAGCSWTLL